MADTENRRKTNKSNRWLVIAGLVAATGLAFSLLNNSDFLSKVISSTDSSETGKLVAKSDSLDELIQPARVDVRDEIESEVNSEALKEEIADSEDSSFKQTVLGNSYTRSLYRDLCEGVPEEGLISIDDGLVDLENLSETQREAYDELKSRCNLWDSHVAKGTWSEGEFEASENDIALTELLNFYGSDTANFEAARELLSSEDARMVIEALWVLLMNDREFQRQVANSAGSTKPEFARSAVTEIIGLVTCRLEGNCGPTSVTMMSLCATVEEACHVGMLSYLRRNNSANHVADVEAMANYVHWLILSSY